MKLVCTVRKKVSCHSQLLWHNMLVYSEEQNNVGGQSIPMYYSSGGKLYI